MKARSYLLSLGVLAGLALLAVALMFTPQGIAQGEQSDCETVCLQKSEDGAVACYDTLPLGSVELRACLATIEAELRACLAGCPRGRR